MFDLNKKFALPDTFLKSKNLYVLLLGLCKVMMVNESSPICHNYANVHFGEFRPFLQKSLSSNQENSIKNLKEKCQINIDFNLFS